MKKISLVIAFAAAIVLAGCNGSKQTKNGSETDSTDVFVEQLIKAGMNMHLDSLTELWLRLKPSSFYSTTQDGKIILSQDEKKVKPEYLFNPEELASKLETMSYKYRALAVYAVDKEVAKLYDMKDVYTPAIKKLAAELNDPSLKFIDENSEKMEYTELNSQAYKIAEENGRANRYWEVAASSIIEQIYLIANNQDKFLANFTDKDAEDMTYRTILLCESFQDLAEYHPDLANLNNVILPLEKLDALTVDKLREQLTELKADIEKSRAQLFE